MVFVTKILFDQVLSEPFSPVDLISYGFVLFFLKRWARSTFPVPSWNALYTTIKKKCLKLIIRSGFAIVLCC